MRRASQTSRQDNMDNEFTESLPFASERRKSHRGDANERGTFKELFLAVTDLGFNFVKQGDVPPHLMDHEYEIHLEKKERVKEAYHRLRSEITGYEEIPSEPVGYGK